MCGISDRAYKNHPDRSLGIIAFSEKQQTAIENVIIDFRERTLEYEWFLMSLRINYFLLKILRMFKRMKEIL